VKRHSSSVAQKVNVPDVVMKEQDEFIRNQDQMQVDGLERSSAGGDSVGNASSLSYKRDGNSISKAFIGGPSNWYLIVSLYTGCGMSN